MNVYGVYVYSKLNDTYQDVQGTLWAIFELFDGGKDWKYKAGEDQEEAEEDTKTVIIIFFK